ncbi:MAG TPA: M48 family metallopeptidase [Burkholderiales bacterium]
MNFFEHQRRARQRTWFLALLFTLATVATLVLTNTVALAVVAALSEDFSKAPTLSAWIGANPNALIWTSLGTLAVIGAASMYRMASLRTGGGAVARSLGGVLVESDAADPQKRRLQNVVEEMAIAAGIPVPQLYVLEQEPGINAFAAGFTTGDAAIAVTRGTLELLTRDELQGVIAHEFSHILNGDMRLNTHLLGVVFGLLFIGLTGRIILRGLAHVRGTSRRGGGQAIAAAFFAGLALVVVGYLGTLFGAMIRAAVSRQREYLADASAVQFTRNPNGIAGALKKIAVSPLRTVLQAAEAEEISHMLIADGRKMFAGFFATHPPILERIKAIDRRFDPAELERIRLQAVTAERGAPPPPRPATIAAVSPALVIASIGVLSAAALDAAARTQANIPDALLRAAHARSLAPALVLALALNPDPAERSRQIARSRERLPEALLEHLDAILTMIAPLNPAHRLPLIELAFPALRQRSPQELRQIVTAVEDVTRMDGRFDVLDYALARLLRERLAEAAAPQGAGPVRSAKLFALRDEVSILFSVIAQTGDRDKHAAQRAYDQGVRRLFGNNVPPYAVPQPWIAPLDRALTRLDGLAPAAKQSVIEALVATVTHDRQINLGEMELLRAICASLHCPVPPMELAPGAVG